MSGFHGGELSEVECRDRVLVPVLVRGRIAVEMPGGELDRTVLIAAIEGVVAP